MDEGEGKRGRERGGREREDNADGGLWRPLGLCPLLGPLIEKDRESREGGEGGGEALGWLLDG